MAPRFVSGVENDVQRNSCKLAKYSMFTLQVSYVDNDLMLV